jgi:hypothetical protein
MLRPHRNDSIQHDYLIISDDVPLCLFGTPTPRKLIHQHNLPILALHRTADSAIIARYFSTVLVVRWVRIANLPVL